jgi:hypothetical protein
MPRLFCTAWVGTAGCPLLLAGACANRGAGFIQLLRVDLALRPSRQLAPPGDQLSGWARARECPIRVVASGRLPGSHAAQGSVRAAALDQLLRRATPAKVRSIWPATTSASAGPVPWYAKGLKLK